MFNGKRNTALPFKARLYKQIKTFKLLALLPEKDAKTFRATKKYQRTFWKKSKSTLKQIRQLSLSYCKIRRFRLGADNRI